MQPYVGLTWVSEDANEVQGVMAVIPASSDENAINRIKQYAETFYYRVGPDGDELNMTPDWPFKAIWGEQMQELLDAHFEQQAAWGSDFKAYDRWTLTDLDDVIGFIDENSAAIPLQSIVQQHPWLKEYASDLLIQKLSK